MPSYTATYTVVENELQAVQGGWTVRVGWQARLARQQKCGCQQAHYHSYSQVAGYVHVPLFCPLTMHGMESRAGKHIMWVCVSYMQVEVLILLNEPTGEWEDKLPQETQDLLANSRNGAKGGIKELKTFPLISTFDANYSPQLTILLSQMNT